MTTRISITKDRTGITATIKSAKLPWPFGFLPVWLVLWTFGGITVLVIVITGRDRDVFILVWLCGWALGEFMAVRLCLWLAFGQEVVSIRDGVFTHRREVFGRGPNRTYPLRELFNLRTSGPFGTEKRFGRRYEAYGMGGGTVAFDAKDGDSIRFGAKLTEDDADDLVRALRPYVTDSSRRSAGFDTLGGG
jgi:hypothetical protein